MKVNHKLPDMEFSFAITVIGNETGIPWAGEFKYKRPTLSQRSQIEAMRARLNADLFTISDDIADLNAALAHLRFTLIQYPEWWKASDFGGALHDANVVTEVYKKVVEFELDWRKKVHGGNPKDVADAEAEGNRPERVADTAL